MTSLQHYEKQLIVAKLQYEANIRHIRFQFMFMGRDLHITLTLNNIIIIIIIDKKYNQYRVTYRKYFQLHNDDDYFMDTELFDNRNDMYEFIINIMDMIIPPPMFY